MDDEPLARARLRGLLAKHADMQLVGECAEGGEAVAAIGRVRPEVVFLDIQMTETSGLDVAPRWRPSRCRPSSSSPRTSGTRSRRSTCARSTTCSSRSRRSGSRATLDRVRTYTPRSGPSARTSTCVAILRELSDTPLSELERLRAPAMPLRFADLEVDTATRDVRRAGERGRASPQGVRPAAWR